MTLPGVQNQVLDNGLGVSSPATSIPHIIGVFESGPVNTPTLVGNQRVLRETFGIFGPGNDEAGFILGLAGGPVVCTRVTSNVAASYTATNLATTTAVSSIGAGADNAIGFVIASSAPKNDFDVKITITLGGARTATKFTYSLDGGLTTSPELSAAATVPLGTSGVTAEFGVGTVAPYVAGATYTMQANAPSFDVTNMNLAFAAAKLSLLNYDFFLIAGDPISSVAGALIFAGVETQLDSFALPATDKYFRAYMNMGREVLPATALASYVAAVGERTGAIFSNFVAPAPFAQPGRGFAKMPAAHFVGLRASGNVISTDLACVSGGDSVGAIPGCVSIGHNEFLAESGLDAAKFGTLRTYANKTGFFLTNAWLHAAPGSDFEFWQHGRIMDQACRIVSAVHTDLISQTFEVKGDGSGSLTEAAAQSIEKRVQRQLDDVIGSALRGKGPTRLDGKLGHVADVAYQVDRTNNVITTKTIIATVTLIPLGYGKRFQATLSFKLQVS